MKGVLGAALGALRAWKLQEAMRAEHNRRLALRAGEAIEWFVQALKVLCLPSCIALFDERDLRRVGGGPSNYNIMHTGLKGGS